LGPAPGIFSPHTTEDSQPERDLQPKSIMPQIPNIETPAPAAVGVLRPPVVQKPKAAPSPFEGMSCEEAIIKWFLSRTQRREKVDIREMYDELEGANYSRDAVKRARCQLAKDGVLCQDGAIETYLYRLSDRYR